MIKGKKVQELTLKAILNHISEYDIYRMYIGYDFKLDKAITSPFKPNEEHPSFSIYPREGRIVFTDYARPEYRGDVVTFVMMLFGLNYNRALEKIDGDFGLGIRGIKKDYKKIVSTFAAPEIVAKRETIIQVNPRKWTQEELDYWAQYGVEKVDMKQKDVQVYVPKEIWINRKRFTIGKRLVFCYLFSNQWWKIYFPFESKENKWLSNVPLDVMYGMDDIKGCEKAIVIKSVKDWLALKKLYPCCAGTQNESTVAISEENIKKLKEGAKEVYIWFDNDVVGRKNSLFYTENYGFKPLFTPDSLISEGVKDLSGWIALDQIEAVKDYLKQKEIL